MRYSNYIFDLNASQRRARAGSNKKSGTAEHVARYNANLKLSLCKFVELARGNKYFSIRFTHEDHECCHIMLNFSVKSSPAAEGCN